MSTKVLGKLPVSKTQSYYGETKSLIRHGYGVYKYPNPFFSYEGEWDKGRKNGHGKLMMNDGSYYYGEFKNGEIEGNGYRYWSISGNKYSGEFHRGEMNGHGVLTYKNGTKYEGEFKSNQREGMGVLSLPNGTVYEGLFHGNRRHGEGKQCYQNGDEYVGDWVFGVRQGSGQMRYGDGSIYDGQWRNDLYNGHGTLAHCSGMTYEGMWINGKPAIVADHMVILGEPVIEVLQGKSFSINVEIKNADGETIEDFGRRLKVSAGFKHMKSADSATNLLNLIEDIEEKPIPTPYGYDIVSYPLTEFCNLSIDEDGSLKIVVPEGGEEEDSETIIDMVKSEEGLSAGLSSNTPPPQENQPNLNTAQSEAAANGDSSGLQPGIDSTGALVSSSATVPNENSPPEQAESLPPPPVNSQRSENGAAQFKELILPAGPAEYQPFLILDQQLAEEEAGKSSKRGKTQNLAQALQIGARVGRSIDSSEVKNKAVDSKQEKLRRQKLYGDERFARPGEYVIMVTDVTSPPFLDKNLEPAFLLVKVLNSIKLTSSTGGKKKDKGKGKK